PIIGRAGRSLGITWIFSRISLPALRRFPPAGHGPETLRGSNYGGPGADQWTRNDVTATLTPGGTSSSTYACGPIAASARDRTTGAFGPAQRASIGSELSAGAAFSRGPID